MHCLGRYDCLKVVQSLSKRPRVMSRAQEHTACLISCTPCGMRPSQDAGPTVGDCYGAQYKQGSVLLIQSCVPGAHPCLI